MATYLCRPKADVLNVGWTINLGTSLWSTLTSEDDGNSFIACTAASKKYYALLDHPLVGSCSSSLMYIRARSSDGTPTLTFGTAQSSTFIDTGTYVTGSDWGQTSFSLTPTPGDVNQTTFACGIETDGSSPQNPRVSWIRLDLVYSEPGSDGWAFLIGSFLGPLVAVGLNEMPGLIRHVNRLAASVPIWHPWSPHRLHQDEAEAYWRSLRSARWPVYST
jgi:hypothetical protein